MIIKLIFGCNSDLMDYKCFIIAIFCTIQKSICNNIQMKVDEESLQNLKDLDQSLKNLDNRTISTFIQQISFYQEISCIQTYNNLLYVGTNESKVLILEIKQPERSREYISVLTLTKIYPHCSMVNFIVAVQKFLVVVPREQQQLIRIWHRDTLQLMQGFKGHQKQITQVLFLKDSKHLASVSHDSTARIWNIYEHSQFDREMVIFKGKYPLLSIEQIDQSTLALGGDDCSITLWNWKKSQAKCQVFGHPGSVFSLSYYFPYLVSSGGDSKIKIWQFRQESGNVSARTIDEVQYRASQQLCLIKQIKGSVSQNQFFFKRPDYRMIVVDSTGKVFLINSSLVVSIQTLKIDYSKKIMSCKIWKDHLLYLTNRETQEEKNIHVIALKQNQDNSSKNFNWLNALGLLTSLVDNSNNKQNFSRQIQQQQAISNEIQKPNDALNLFTTLIGIGAAQNQIQEIKQQQQNMNGFNLFAQIIGAVHPQEDNQQQQSIMNENIQTRK